MLRNENMFQSLRLSVGGGMNGVTQKVAQADNTVTLCIGVGGTGIDALRQIKKTVYERVEQDNLDKRDTEDPIYNRIRFLAIDSDSSGIESPYRECILRNDFFDICETNVLMDIHDGIDRIEHLNWLNRELELCDTYRLVPSPTRQVSRYLLSKKAYVLYHKIRNIITSSISGLQCGFNLNINILASLGGATGGGCFIDVCYIVQQVLHDTGMNGCSCVNGFFFLPDVNLSKPGFRRGGPEEFKIKSNGFAALKELDYLMNIPDNGDVFEHRYSGSFGIKLNTPPVNMCQLLSTTDVNGEVIRDGYNYTMNVVSEYILNMVVKSWEADPSGANSGITLKGIEANIKALSRFTNKTYGANYVYNILGVSCATVPYKEIGAYLATKFFDTIKYIKDHVAVKSNVEQFCNNVGLIFNRLDQEVTRGFESFPDISDFSVRDLMVGDRNHILKPLNRRCEDWKLRCASIRRTNIHNLGQPMGEFDAKTVPESVVGRIFKELTRIIQNADLGPYFAYSMLHNSQQATIMTELAGIKEEVKRRRDLVQRLLYDKYDQMAAAFDGMRITLGIPCGKERYLSCVEEVFRTENDKETYSDFLDLLDKIEAELKHVTENYFKKYVGVTDDLITTFEDNALYFETHGMVDDMFTWNIVDIENIKDELDEAIAQYVEKTDNGELIAPHLVKAFSQLMLSNRDKWIDENETKIAELISTFIRNQFRDAMSKSMVEYLQEKYNVTGSALIKCISDKIIKNGLAARCAPMFYGNPAVYLKDYVEYSILYIPADTCLEVAARDYRDKYGMDRNMMGIACNVFDDRILMFNCYGGIPMFAYKVLGELEATYMADSSPGLHLYEGKSKDWRNLPSPIPATFVSSFYKRPNQESVDEIIAVYDRAIDEKLIVEDMDNMCAKVYSTQSYDLTSILGTHLSEDAIVLLKDIIALDGESRNAKISEVIETNKWDVDAANIERALIELNDFINKYKDSYISSVELTAYNRYTNGFYSSLRDDFVMKPVIVEAVRNEINKIDFLRCVCDVLENINKYKHLKNDFIRALLYSVIYKQRGLFIFDFEKNGETESVILNADFERGFNIPVYRAFLNYKKLGAEIIEQIAEKTHEAAMNITDEMYKNAKAFQEDYEHSYEDCKNEVNFGYYENKDAIISFLDELYEKLNRFIRENK